MHDAHAGIIGRKIIHHDQTDSTNKEAINWITKKDPIEGTVIMADYQTAGRGQFDRTWQSERGLNIMLSVILKPQFLHPTRQFYLNKMASVAVADAIYNTSGLSTRVKWPNDIYCNESKLAGILIQNFLTAKVIRHTVVGIGININQKSFSDKLGNASSVFLETGRIHDRASVTDNLLESLNKTYILLREKPEKLKESYMNKLLGFKELRIFDDGIRRFEGRIKGIDEYGRLLVDSDMGLKSYDNNSIKMCFE